MDECEILYVEWRCVDEGPKPGEPTVVMQVGTPLGYASN